MDGVGTRPRMLWWLAGGLLAALALIVTATTMTSRYEVPVLVSYVAATAQCAALPLVFQRPWVAILLQFAGVGVFAVVSPQLSGIWPLTAPVMIILLAHVGLVGAFRSWREALATWWASALFCIVLALADPRGRTIDDAETSLIVYTTNSVLVLFGTIAWRQRGAVRRQLTEARRDMALEQAQRALVEERNRIARELHDVVAHSMSVIHMQATSAAYRITDVDAESRAEFKRIAAGTRATLREMRQLLALLRDETTDSELRPMPDLEHLGELVESARRGGIPVELAVTGDIRTADLPDTVALAAYRIVQESLSNVVRHAPGASTRVRVSVDDTELTVEVTNDVPTRVPGPIEDAGRVSHGLVGMRERVRLTGGSLHAGARPEGGYRVTARFPLNTFEEGNR
jgi:signal transduction histidine kinase